MTYDYTCKYLVDTYPEQFSQWLLGYGGRSTVLKPTELSLAPIRADAVVLAHADTLLHIEFQTQPVADMSLRMLDYRVRLLRNYPNTATQQYVIYLRQSQSPLVYENTFTIPNLQFSYNVLRLWEVSPADLAPFPGLLPFTVLSQTADPVEQLQRVRNQLLQIDNLQQRRELAAATTALAGLALDKALIEQILGGIEMRESVMVQGWLEEGRQEGVAQSVMRQLQRKLGDLSEAQAAQIEGLPLVRVEELAVVLLDFEKMSDLEAWLED